MGKRIFSPDWLDGMPYWVFLLRVVWIAIQFMLILWFGQKGVPFIYQGF